MYIESGHKYTIFRVRKQCDFILFLTQVLVLKKVENTSTALHGQDMLFGQKLIGMKPSI